MNGSNGSSSHKSNQRVWTVVCAVAAVVLGPAAVTASALDQANAAPLHHLVKVKVDQSQAYLPDQTRRRATTTA